MKTLYLQHALLNHITGRATYAKPAASYIGLLTDDPTPAGDLTKEVSGGGYARVQATWGAPVANLMKTTTDTFFDNLPATTVKYWGIFDAANGGNLLEYFPMRYPLNVPATQDLTIDAGNFMLREG